MAGLLQTQLHAGKGTTPKLIFTTKSKFYPTCSNINTQLNLQINHRGDENLPAPRGLPDGCREKGGNLQHEVPCRCLAAGQCLPVPAPPGGMAAQAPTARQHARAPRGTAGHPAEPKDGLVCARRAGQHSFRGSSSCGSGCGSDTRLQTPLLQCK